MISCYVVYIVNLFAILLSVTSSIEHRTETLIFCTRNRQEIILCFFFPNSAAKAADAFRVDGLVCSAAHNDEDVSWSLSKKEAILCVMVYCCACVRTIILEKSKVHQHQYSTVTTCCCCCCCRRRRPCLSAISVIVI